MSGTQTNLVTNVTSSQGFSAYGVSNVKKCTAKVARGSSASASQLDSSTLALAHGSYRTYENGLDDSGAAGGDGIVVTVSMEGFGSGPSAGSTITAEGKTCKCMDVTGDDNVGELHTWSASYTSDY
jgi:hypothetical protein